MRPMILAFVAIIVIAIAAHQGLQYAGFSSQERNASADTRLD